MQVSARAFLAGVGTAFLFGLVASLAVRPANSGMQSDAMDARPLANDVAQIVVDWRVPVAFGTNLPALGDNILYVAGALSDLSSGTVRLRPFEPGELTPPLAITESVGSAKVPAGYTWLGYDTGRIPSSTLFAAVPFGMEPWEFSAWWFEAGGRELAREVYHPHGVEPVFCGLIGPETAGWFRKPVNTVDDFAGLKIRFAGLGGEILQKLGASVTLLPGGEIFPALEKGAIDASEYSLPVVDQTLGFDRVARFNYFPGWHQTFTAAHLLVGLDTWQGLSPGTRAQVETACTAGVTRNLARSEALQGEVIDGFAAKGVTVTVLERDVLQRLRDTANVVLDEQAMRDEDFRRVLASQREFQRKNRSWRRVAYLPRDF